MNALIIFDVPNQEERDLLIDGLRGAGFARAWTYGANNEFAFGLPHNVLWKMNTTIDEARIQFDNVVRQINVNRGNRIVINRFLIVPAYPWSGFSPE